jgi:hypothetical protein
MPPNFFLRNYNYNCTELYTYIMVTSFQSSDYFSTKSTHHFDLCVRRFLPAALKSLLKRCQGQSRASFSPLWKRRTHRLTLLRHLWISIGLQTSEIRNPITTIFPCPYVHNIRNAAVPLCWMHATDSSTYDSCRAGLCRNPVGKARNSIRRHI